MENEKLEGEIELYCVLDEHHSERGNKALFFFEGQQRPSILSFHTEIVCLNISTCSDKCTNQTRFSMFKRAHLTCNFSQAFVL